LAEEFCNVFAALDLGIGEAVERNDPGSLVSPPVLIERIVHIIDVEIFADHLLGEIAMRHEFRTMGR
jgi:hypothetical protein